MNMNESNEAALNQHKNSYAEPIPQYASVGYYARRVREIISKHKPEWTPEDVRDRLTPELATQMRLWPMVEHLPCPDELNRKTDLRYVAWAAYPETKTVSEDDLVHELFQGIVSGERQKFPSKYFYGADGNRRARKIFAFFMNEYAIPQFDVTCLKDAYEVFASDAIYRLIDKCHLSAYVREWYHIPLNYLHACLGNHADDIAYYNMFFHRAKRATQSDFLLDSDRVRQLNGGTLPKEYEEYLEMQEKRIERRMKEGVKAQD